VDLLSAVLGLPVEIAVAPAKVPRLRAAPPPRAAKRAVAGVRARARG